MSDTVCDVLVVGGGAAGLMCSLNSAERGLDTVLLEPNAKLGRKLRITGKGRCNVTNNCEIREVLSNIPGDGRFLYSSLNAFPPSKVMEFCNKNDGCKTRVLQPLFYPNGFRALTGSLIF